MPGVIEKLQALDEPTKRKVLIIATIVIMLGVLYFWLAYFNNLIASVSNDNQVATAQQPDIQASSSVSATQSSYVAEDNSGIFQGMKNSFAFIGAEFGGLFRVIGGIFKGPRQYTVQPSQ